MNKQESAGISAAEKLAMVEEELAGVRAEYKSFRSAVRDRALAAWVDGLGPIPKRKLTSFEGAGIKRMYDLRAKLRGLEAAQALLVARTLDETAGQRGEGADDPEALLRAALVVLARAWQAGHRDTEHKVVLRAIAAYLESLDEEGS